MSHKYKLRLKPYGAFEDLRTTFALYSKKHNSSKESVKESFYFFSIASEQDRFVNAKKTKYILLYQDQHDNNAKF